MIRTSVVCLVALVAAGPPQRGVEVTGQGGAGRLQYGGCNGQLYTVETGLLYGRVRMAGEEGWAGTIEGSALSGRVISRNDGKADDPPEVGRFRRWHSAAARFGKHFQYGGLELGGVLLPKTNVQDDYAGLTPTLSGSGWAGIPDLVYGWGNFAAGSLAMIRVPVEVGVGHSGRYGDVEVGLGGQGGTVSASLKTLPWLRPGFELRLLDKDNWSASIRLGIFFGFTRPSSSAD